MEYVLRMCKPCFLQRIVSSVGILILFEADSTVIWDGKPRHCVGVDSTASKSRDQSKEPGCQRDGWFGFFISHRTSAKRICRGRLRQ